jgi:hypothetical protein
MVCKLTIKLSSVSQSYRTDIFAHASFCAESRDTPSVNAGQSLSAGPPGRGRLVEILSELLVVSDAVHATEVSPDRARASKIEAKFTRFVARAKKPPDLQGRPQSHPCFLSRSKTLFRHQYASYVRSTCNVDTTAPSISSNPVQLGLAARCSRCRAVSQGRKNLSASTDYSKPHTGTRHGQIPPRFGRRRA